MWGASNYLKDGMPADRFFETLSNEGWPGGKADLQLPSGLRGQGGLTTCPAPPTFLAKDNRCAMPSGLASLKVDEVSKLAQSLQYIQTDVDSLMSLLSNLAMFESFGMMSVPPARWYDPKPDTSGGLLANFAGNFWKVIKSQGGAGDPTEQASKTKVCGCLKTEYQLQDSKGSFSALL